MFLSNSRITRPARCDNSNHAYRPMSPPGCWLIETSRRRDCKEPPGREARSFCWDLSRTHHFGIKHSTLIVANWDQTKDNIRYIFFTFHLNLVRHCSQKDYFENFLLNFELSCMCHLDRNHSNMNYLRVEKSFNNLKSFQCYDLR